MNLNGKINKFEIIHSILSKHTEDFRLFMLNKKGSRLLELDSRFKIQNTIQNCYYFLVTCFSIILLILCSSKWIRIIAYCE